MIFPEQANEFFHHGPPSMELGGVGVRESEYSLINGSPRWWRAVGANAGGGVGAAAAGGGCCGSVGGSVGPATGVEVLERRLSNVPIVK